MKKLSIPFLPLVSVICQRKIARIVIQPLAVDAAQAVLGTSDIPRALPPSSL